MKSVRTYITHLETELARTGGLIYEPFRIKALSELDETPSSVTNEEVESPTTASLDELLDSMHEESKKRFPHDSGDFYNNNFLKVGWNACLQEIKPHLAAILKDKDERIEGDWKLVGHSYQIADTGDYDGHWEITNGNFKILSKDDDEETLQAVVNALNKSGCKFYGEDFSGELGFAWATVKELQTQLKHKEAAIAEYQRKADAANKKIEKMQAQLTNGREEAIGFAEWVNEKDIVQNNDGKWWKNNPEFAGVPYSVSTAQLYSLYLQSKKENV